MTPQVLQDEDEFFLISDGERGIAGTNGINGSGAALIVNFAYGDATPKLLMTTGVAKRVYSVEMFIQTAFNGTGATLKIGSAGSPSELMGVTENDPAQMAGYETSPDKLYASATPIYLTIVPGSGASAGSGQILLNVEP